jgi:hypothetical protein
VRRLVGRVQDFFRSYREVSERNRAIEESWFFSNRGRLRAEAGEALERTRRVATEAFYEMKSLAEHERVDRCGAALTSFQPWLS